MNDVCIYIVYNPEGGGYNEAEGGITLEKRNNSRGTRELLRFERVMPPSASLCPTASGLCSIIYFHVQISFFCTVQIDFVILNFKFCQILAF